MEKLELKHLAPYLPYGLIMRDSDGIYKEDRILTFENMKWLLSNGQLILRLLSDLTKDELKEIHRKCPNLPNWQDFHKEWINDYEDLSETIIEYAVIEILLSWHFDIFGLIEKGLAIDKNKLAQLK